MVLKFLAGYIKTQQETILHKIRVLFNIILLINKLDPPNKWQLYWRGWKHDCSKLGWYEAKHYALVIFDLKGSTYGSDQYKEKLVYIQPAINHHYKKNSHHPEYHENGIDGMSELDKLELPLNKLLKTKKHALIGGFKGKHGFEYDASYLYNFHIKDYAKVDEKLNEYNTQESALIISPNDNVGFHKNKRFKK